LDPQIGFLIIQLNAFFYTVQFASFSLTYMPTA